MFSSTASKRAIIESWVKELESFCPVKSRLVCISWFDIFRKLFF